MVPQGSLGLAYNRRAGGPAGFDGVLWFLFSCIFSVISVARGIPSLAAGGRAWGRSPSCDIPLLLYLQPDRCLGRSRDRPGWSVGLSSMEIMWVWREV